MEQPVFSLLQVMQSVSKTISGRYGSAFWVRAEMNKLNHYSHSGHCYPELVEKQGGKVIAQVNATLWRDDFLRANQRFLQILEEPLRDGIKILFKAKVSFDPIHGLSLNILEIDPAFTLGDLEREKKQTLDTLQKEGILDNNKKLAMPILPQRIAVISVETSKGYADFLSVIDSNQWHYHFFHMLFPSILQGEKAVSGITSQLERIRKVVAHFDLVAIIRGGGGDVGLSVYNNYNLARAIATFPIPVWSGIGHATNLTATEMVSHSHAITPTKLADMLLQRFHESAQPLGNASRILAMHARGILDRKKIKLSSEGKLFRSVSMGMLFRRTAATDAAAVSISRSAAELIAGSKKLVMQLHADASRDTARYLVRERQSQKQLEMELGRQFHVFLSKSNEAVIYASGQINAMDPANVLKRGFSITRYQGIAVRDASQVPDGGEMESELFAGVIKSRKI